MIANTNDNYQAVSREILRTISTMPDITKADEFKRIREDFLESKLINTVSLSYPQAENWNKVLDSLLDKIDKTNATKLGNWLLLLTGKDFNPAAEFIDIVDPEYSRQQIQTEAEERKMEAFVLLEKQILIVKKFITTPITYGPPGFYSKKIIPEGYKNLLDDINKLRTTNYESVEQYEKAFHALLKKHNFEAKFQELISPKETKEVKKIR